MAEKEGIDFEQAVRFLKEGQVVLYPTETFYALGTPVTAENGIRQIAEIKNRNQAKPFPVIAGSMEQVCRYADLPPLAEKLAEFFWPGPLSILVRCKIPLAEEVRDKHGFTALRLTSHPVAQALCLESQSLLLATSANFATLPPAREPRELDAELKTRVAGCLLAPPLPAGGLPSTLVRLDEGGLSILREGSIPAQTIWDCVKKQ